MPAPASPHAPFFERLARHAAERPAAPALGFVRRGRPDEILSWAELDSTVRRLGSHLTAQGVEPGDVVLVLSTAPREQTLGFLAAMASGAVPSIISFPSVKQSRQRFLDMLASVVHSSRARWILRAEELAGALAGWDEIAGSEAQVLAFPDLATLEGAEHTPPELAEDRPLFLQFSSGTTGARKGVAVTHSMFVHQAVSYAEALGLGPADRVANWLPLYHDNGLVGCFLLPLYLGASSLHLAPFEWVEEPVLVFQAVDRHRATLLWSPNFAFSFCARRIAREQLAGLRLDSLRAFLTGGELVRVRTRRAFLERFAGTGIEERHLAVCYGMAENTFVATQTQIGVPARVDTVDRDAFFRERRALPVAAGSERALAFVSCGPTIPRHEIRIAGASGERQVGEIEIASDCLFAGYVTADGLAAQDVFTPDGWYRSGDLGYLAGGELFVTGRAKDLIIHRGINLHPDDLQEVAASVPGTKPGRVVVFGLFDETEGTEQIVAMLETDGPDVDRQEIAWRVREAVAEHFGVSLLDARVCEPGTLLKTTSGKLSREANRELYRRQAAAAGEPAGGRQRLAPRDAWERELVAIWQETLGVRPIGVDENLFLELGAGSLAALAAAGEVRARLGRAIEAHQLLADETIERQAARLRGAAGKAGKGGESNEASALVAIRSGGANLPLFLVHPAGGDPWSYLALARRLGPEQPVYAFQDPHRNADAGAFDSLEEMAAAYVAELAAFHPGPYVLGGWSLGGAIAFEMACQLVAAGREVASVVMLDTFKPGGPLRLAWFRAGQAVSRRVLRSFGMARAFRLLQGGRALSPMIRLTAMAYIDYGWCDRRLVAASFPGLYDPEQLDRLPPGELWEHLFRRIPRARGSAATARKLGERTAAREPHRGRAPRAGPALRAAADLPRHPHPVRPARPEGPPRLGPPHAPAARRPRARHPRHRAGGRSSHRHDAGGERGPLRRASRRPPGGRHARRTGMITAALTCVSAEGTGPRWRGR